MMARSALNKAFFRGAGTLIGGSASAQIILLVASPILTRLYSAADFGLLSVLLALVALSEVVSTGRYELAITLPEHDRDALDVIGLCLMLLSAAVLLCVLGVHFFALELANIVGMPSLESAVIFLPVAVLFIGMCSVFNYWSLRQKNFSVVAKARVWQSGATTAVQIGFATLTSLGLVMGHVAGLFVAALLLTRNVWRTPEFAGLKLKNTLAAAYRYREFPIYSTWSGLFNSSGSHLPPLILAAAFSAPEVGYFALANRIVMTPLSLVGAALKSTFFSFAADSMREGSLTQLVSELLRVLANVILLPAIVVALMAPELFSFVFGGDWLPAGELARWLAPWLTLQFCYGPISAVTIVKERQGLETLLQLQLLIVRVAALLIGVLSRDFDFAVMLFGLGSAISYLIALVVVLALVKMPFERVLSVIVEAVAVSTCIALPVVLAVILAFGSVGYLIAGTTTTVFYCARLYLLLSGHVLIPSRDA